MHPQAWDIPMSFDVLLELRSVIFICWGIVCIFMCCFANSLLLFLLLFSTTTIYCALSIVNSFHLTWTQNASSFIVFGCMFFSGQPCGEFLNRSFHDKHPKQFHLKLLDLLFSSQQRCRFGSSKQFPGFRIDRIVRRRRIFPISVSGLFSLSWKIAFYLLW